jgi:hypothetical protein
MALQMELSKQPFQLDCLLVKAVAELENIILISSITCTSI